MLSLDENGSYAGIGVKDHRAKDNSLLGAADFPQFPGEDCLSHTAALYKEQAEARLTTLGLLSVANGLDPSSVRSIIDYDDPGDLPPGHRDFERRKVERMKLLAHNRSNAERRYDLRMTAWTSLYALLKASTEISAPVLSRELKELCDLAITRGLPGGYFDGPRAWRLILHRLSGQQTHNTHNAERTVQLH